MVIADGGEAMEAYHGMCALVDRPEELAELRQALLVYCRKDTLAMVRLVEVLEKVLSGYETFTWGFMTQQFQDSQVTITS